MKRPVRFGIAAGTILILAVGTAYLVPLRERGSLFYAAAALVFVAAPLTAALLAAGRTPRGSGRAHAFVRSGSGVFGIAIGSFIATYGVFPEFNRTSVQLPPFCGDFAATHPHLGAITLLADDGHASVVASIHSSTPPFPTTIYLVRKDDNRVLWSDRFENDIIAAAIDNRTLYLYNDKSGFWIDTRTGARRPVLFTIDNYGGLSPTDRPVLVSRKPTGRWFMETTALISSWNSDGSVLPRHRVTFNAVAFNCFIHGASGAVTPLWSPENSPDAK